MLVSHHAYTRDIIGIERISEDSTPRQTLVRVPVHDPYLTDYLYIYFTPYVMSSIDRLTVMPGRPN